MRRIAVGVMALTLFGTGCGRDAAVSLGPVPSPPVRSSTTGPSPSPSPSPSVTTASPSPSPTSTSSGRTIALQVWFARDGRLFASQRIVPFTLAVGGASLQALSEGPSPVEVAARVGSDVPVGTSFTITALSGGIATVETSYADPGDGGLGAAQIVFTLTQFPSISRVRLLGRLWSRASFERLMPAIVVVSPAVGVTVSSPLAISGTADVYEATVSVRVLDADGNVLVSTFTTATCGTGCRGDYSLTVRFSVDHDQPGTIEVFDYSAKDGSVENLQSIPVVLGA